jgi:hypothetical protein
VRLSSGIETWRAVLRFTEERQLSGLCCKCPSSHQSQCVVCLPSFADGEACNSMIDLCQPSKNEGSPSAEGAISAGRLLSMRYNWRRLKCQRRGLLTQIVWLDTQDPGKVVESDPDGLGFASVADRYQTGAAQALKEQRDAMIEQRERKFERQRDLNLDKEEARWHAAMEQHHMVNRALLFLLLFLWLQITRLALTSDQQQAERERRLAEGSKGSSNHSSVAYDTVTLEYHPSVI